MSGILYYSGPKDLSQKFFFPERKILGKTQPSMFIFVF